MPYIVAPASDFSGNILTTMVRAQIYNTTSLTGLINGTAYRALHLSDASDVFTPQAAATAPSQVTGLTATPGDTQVVLAWNAVTANPAVTGYKIERRIGTGSWATLVASHTGTSYTDTGLTNGTSYGYRVSAINSVGTGPASVEATATPVAAAGVPPQVTGLTATPGAYQNTLAWSATTASPAVTGYKVERRIGTGAWVTFVASQTATSYVDTGLDVGVPYGYRVTAINANGAGTPSAESIGTPTAAATLAPLSGILDAPNVIVLGDSIQENGFGGPSLGGVRADVQQIFSDLGFTGTLRSLAVSAETINDQAARIPDEKTALAATAGQNVYFSIVGVNNLQYVIKANGYEPHATFDADYSNLVSLMKSGGDKALPMPITKVYKPWAPFVVAGDPTTDFQSSLPYSENYIYKHIPEEWMRPDGRPWVDPYRYVDNQFGSVEPETLGYDGLHLTGPDLSRHVLAKMANRALGKQPGSRAGKSLIYGFSNSTMQISRILPGSNILSSNTTSAGFQAAKFSNGEIDADVVARYNGITPRYETALIVDQPTIDAAFAKLPDTRFHNTLFLTGHLRSNSATPATFTWKGLFPGDTVQLSVAVMAPIALEAKGNYTLVNSGETIQLQAHQTSALNHQAVFAPVTVPPDGTITMTVALVSGYIYVNAVILDFL